MQRLRPLAVALAALVLAVNAQADTAGAQAEHPSSDFGTLAAELTMSGKEPDDIASHAGAAARSLAPSGDASTSTEHEDADRSGRNDEIDRAERTRVAGHGRTGDARILGTLADIAPPVVRTGPFAEDDGAITMAHPSGLSTAQPSVRIAGTIGDGPHGATTGDFDFFRVSASAGTVLTVDVDARALGSDLDAVVAVLDDDGAILAFNDDSPELDSFVQFPVPSDGDYLVAVTAFGSLPTNPFDPASGTGATTTGDYEVLLTTEFAEDVDVYRLNLRQGDVLGASVSGGGRVLELLGSHGEALVGSGRDKSADYPDSSPLVMPGNAVLDHVTDADGAHYLRVSHGVGPYEIELRVRRPALESAGRGEHQILFVDVDGATIDPSTFGTKGGDLSPLSDFIGGWGLGPDDEDALVDAIVARITENIASDGEAGGNRRFDVEIRNSRDDPDPWGEPNVSRLVIGGTIEELGFPTVGLAPSVDPGNFDREETAVVLLDQASAPAGSGVRTINEFVVPGVDVIALVGSVLGFVASHEAGHILGNHHTAPDNGVTSIMDTFDITQLGLGPDLVFGTADDVDVDFVVDDHTEGYTGQQDTLTRTAFGLSSGRGH